MKKIKSIIRLIGSGVGVFVVCFTFDAQAQDKKVNDSLPGSRYRPSFRPKDRYGDPFSTNQELSPFILKDPPALKLNMKLDTNNNYILREKIGDVEYRPPTGMSFREYNKQHDRTMRKTYWQNKSKAQDGESAVSGRSSLIPKIYLGPTLNRIFGGDKIDFQFRGYATLDFGGLWQKVENPQLSPRQQKTGGFIFNQQMNMSLTGKIGEKMGVTLNYDNNTSFSFQNQMKVEYTGSKEDLLKKLEFGNVSLPLNNSLITGSQNLFGVKAQLQFGKMFVTAIASTQRGKQSTVRVSSGANGASQGRPFQIQASAYDDNRNFFLAHFFRDNYEKWFSTIPQITSGLNVTRVEVYVLNRQVDTQTQRNVVGLMDLGESRRVYRTDKLSVLPGNLPADNSTNNLYDLVSRMDQNKDTFTATLEAQLGLTNGTDYVMINSARKLDPAEFYVNKDLGYINLQRKLQDDEALAVAFQYTYNGKVYQVGELNEQYSTKPDREVAILKLLRPNKINIHDGARKIIPTWDLMMKNIYNLNVTGLSREGFQLRIIYRDDRTGKDNPQLQEGTVASTKQLIQALGLDRLNPYNDPTPDGNFDYVENVTIYPGNTTQSMSGTAGSMGSMGTQNNTGFSQSTPPSGLVVFPYLEPFNTPLQELFKSDNNKDYLTNKYVYDGLYTETKTNAEQMAAKNKFWLVGSLQSGSGAEVIIQGFNIAPNSVKVFAGGQPLVEGQDYRVDYTFGKVTFLNPSILNSGKDIDITYEQQDPFQYQARSLLGTRFDYKLSPDVNLGATFLYYNERPIIQRQSIGSEPPRNFQYGLDFNIKKNSRFLTKMVDALPILQTKETSTITAGGEFAQLLPGTSNTINKEGTSFIDDFENSAKPQSLMNIGSWHLSSVPKTPDFALDPANGQTNDIAGGNLRAKLAWYTIDNIYYRDGDQYKPSNISSDDMGNHYVRRVIQQEIFPKRDVNQVLSNEPIFDVAYYPEERGPHNYSTNANADGTLKNPEKNWAGITTAIRSEVDFDKANVEYIEFWMMDPFINTEQGKVLDGRLNKNNTTGGKVVFQLGSVSEDFIKDGKFAFENGLPRDGNMNTGTVTANHWGYVTNLQYTNNAFDNASGSRPNQDVGLDGINDEAERQKFQPFLNALQPEARRLAQADPASDNFRHHLDSYYNDIGAKALQRYKDFNGLENNSPLRTGDDNFSTQGSPYPDKEDLNDDNTLSQLEEYYAYNIDLTPGNLKVGKKYIVDKITPPADAVGQGVSWYLFRIPVRSYDSKTGNIANFNSIKYMRMYLTGFKQPVVMRLANFRTVGNQWRTYNKVLSKEGFTEEMEPNSDNFSVSTVNVEENGVGNSVKPPYIEPIERDYDYTSTVRRRLNEQSIQLSVTGLQDGDSRAIFKTTTVDLFNYGRVKMFMSAHSNTDQPIGDNQLTGFLRLGTDEDQNYFEVELPLKMTPNGPSVSQEEVWPEENQIDIELTELYALKIARDRESYPLNALYPQEGSKQVGRHRIRLLGRPDMSSVKYIMIGIRNLKTPDGRPYDVSLWADELRVTNFDRKAGWATNLNMTAKLADLGTVGANFRHIGFGYGNVQSRIAERSRGETNSYGVTAQLNLDKLLPQKAGLVIPVYVGYNRVFTDPNYDPANPDVRINAALQSFTNDQERSEYKKIIRDETVQRSLNFTNVRKIKTNKESPSRIYDIENFSFTYAFSESKQTNFNLLENTVRNTNGSVTWQYNPKFEGIEPFKNSKWLKTPFLKWLKDFNFNPIPNSMMVRGDVQRSFTKMAYRNTGAEADHRLPNYQKFMVFNRTYSMRWNLTKALTLDYNAVANAIIDEPYGDIDTQQKRDSILNNIKRLGRLKNFQQRATLNYTLPLSKFPVTDWINADAHYEADYNWKAGPYEKTDSLKLGNIISNNRSGTLTGRFNLVTLYNKIKYFKEINTPPRPAPPKKKDDKDIKPDPKAPKAEEARAPDNFLLKGLIRLLLSIRNITFNYDLSESTILPGFTPTPSRLGLDAQWRAPGVGFILGAQDGHLAERAGNNGWITRNPRLTLPFTQNQTNDISVKMNVEPLNGLLAVFDWRKTTNAGYQEIYRFDAITNKFGAISPSRSGSYKISFLPVKTAFKNNGAIYSEVFEEFKQNIGIIQKRFQGATGNEYRGKAQDVLIPAFIAAYTGKSANDISLASFPKIPLPNWRLDYNGLNKIEALKSIFQTISISHAYVASYTASNYTNSMQYFDPNLIDINSDIEDYNRLGFATYKDKDGNVVPLFVVGQILISESFAPLAGLTFRTVGNLDFRVEYRTKRDVTLNVSNAQVSELNSTDWSVAVGYIKSNLKLPFRDQGRIITLKNEVAFRLNMSMTNMRVLQRKIEEESLITNGQVNFQLRPNITYTISKSANVQAYVERTIFDPLVSNSFRRATTRVGFKLTINFSQ